MSSKAHDPLTSAFNLSNNNNPLLTKKVKETGKKENLTTKEKLKEDLRGNGMNFTPNKGQVADMSGAIRPDVLYTSDAGNASVYLRKTGLSYVISNMGDVMHEIDEKIEEAEHSGKLGIGGEEKRKEELVAKAMLKGYRVDIDFVNCKPNIRTINEDAVSGKLNFYYPHCKDGVTGVSQYNKITYQNIYHKIDVIYYGGKAQGLKYDLVVQPGGNPKDIQLKYSGADNISLVNGKIQVKTALGNIQEWMPKVYQHINGKEVKVKADYVLIKPSSTANGSTPSPFGRDGEGLLSFNVGNYNPNYPLIIDPWITYYGGNKSDLGFSIANDNLGNVLVTGITSSSPFPISAGAFQTTYAGFGDVFVLSLSPNGMTRNFATYFGGTGDDRGNGICSDASNDVIVAGQTLSLDLPWGAIGSNVVFQNAVIGGGGFLVKLDQSGMRQFATYYNGYFTDVCIDSFDNIIAYGYTANPLNIATVGAYKTSPSGGDAFVVKFQNNGSRTWGTYFGGSSSLDERSNGVCVDRTTNDIYFTGYTGSANFTVTAGAHQTSYGGNTDAFLTKLSPTGALLWSTYYGGREGDLAYAICTDQLGNVIIGGETNTPTSASIRTIGPDFSGVSDAFIVKFNSAGVRQWGTYLGGSLEDYCSGLACDDNHNIVAGGDAFSNDLPVTSCAYQTTRKGNGDIWLGTFSPTGSIICLGYLGGIGPSNIVTNIFAGGSISVFGCQSHIVASSQGQWPVTAGAYQTAFGGGNGDVDIAQLDISACGLPVLRSANSSTVSSIIGCNCNGAVTLSLTADCKLPPFGYYYSNGAQTLNTTALSDSQINLCAGVYTYTITSSCDVISGSFTIGATNETFTVTPTVSLFCNSGTANLSAGSNNTTATYTWTGPSMVSGVNSPNPVVNQVGTYTVGVSYGSCTSFSLVTVTQNTTSVKAAFTSDPKTGVVPLDMSFINLSTGASAYDWRFGNGSSSTLLNPKTTYNTSGTFTIMLIATSGFCTDIAYYTVLIEEGLTLEIPNVFTPNEDGANDLFSIKSTGIKTISLEIFNRWGEKLVELSGTTATWDGLNSNGDKVSDGTYFYVIQATGFDDKKIKKIGTVNLFRN
ncbi:MAG: gliding motility-associated C-terminal domain-containing protein [Bacteroidota bacterium]